MKYVKKILVLSAAMPLVAACAGMYDFNGVEGMASNGSAFQQALHKEYVRLATLERDEADWSDAAFFLDLAAKSASGQAVDPQPIADRNLPADKVDMLAGARARLVAALNDGGAVRKPGPAARAQAGFDCWMQEQEENFQPEDIAACKKYFDDAMAELEAKPMAKPMPKPAPMPKPEPKPIAPTNILFDFDSAAIDANSLKILEGVAAAAKSWPGKLVITGYTDTSGKDAYNAQLSKDRAMAVAATLDALGIAKDKMVTGSLGEGSLAVPTGDNVKERMNRRVVIKFVK